jgi:hypothetical protein
VQAEAAPEREPAEVVAELAEAAPELAAAERELAAAERELAEMEALTAAEQLIARIAKPSWSALGVWSGMARIKSAWLRTAA